MKKSVSEQFHKALSNNALSSSTTGELLTNVQGPIVVTTTTDKVSNDAPEPQAVVVKDAIVVYE